MSQLFPEVQAAGRLGFGRFSHFQRALREGRDAVGSPPLDQVRRALALGQKAGRLGLGNVRCSADLL